MVPSVKPATSTNSTGPWTIRRVVAWVTEDFKSRGIEAPRLEAEILLCHVLRCERLTLLIDRDRELDPLELSQYRRLVLRRRDHEPAAYLIGRREFYGIDFEVDSNVLIPRQDTETLVEVALERTRDRSMFGLAVDVCTGSGNVAISFARERRTWRVVGVDLSFGAIGVARRNAVRTGAVWNTWFAQGDVLSPVREHGPFDLVIANPPYIPTAEITGLPAEIRDHEPRRALDGGLDGLDMVRRLITEAPSCLKTDGVLALEIGFDQGRKTAQLMAGMGYTEVRVNADLGNRERVVSGIRPSNPRVANV